MRKFTPLALACLLLAVSCQKSDRSLDASAGDDYSIQMQSAKASGQDLSMIQRCAAHEVLQRQIAQNPDRGRRLEALERIIQEKSNTGQGSGKGKPGSGGGTQPPIGPITIPVVVHLVLPSNVTVSDQQIRSQIDVLNADFNKANSELTPGVYLAGNDPSIIANCQITFNWIDTKRKTATGTFGTNDAVKYDVYGGSNTVSPTTVLNMWVCDLTGGLLGYAQFPGGSAATDGVVIDYQAFGTSASYQLYEEFNKGRTATHEIGHWLNLRHIWGDSRCGNDYVGDTPQHDGANYGCPRSDDRSFCKGKVSYDMWMNYMDYTYDACMYMFTVKQKERMDLTIQNARAALLPQTRMMVTTR